MAIKDYVKKPDWLNRIGDWAKSVVAIWAAIGLVIAGFSAALVWLGERQEWIAENKAKDAAEREREAQKCITFPTVQERAEANLEHSVEDAAPGAMSRVTWVLLSRAEHCKDMCVRTSIVNGQGLEHSVKTTIERGVCDDISLRPGLNVVEAYGFEIPSSAQPGCGRLMMKIRFGSEGNFKLSPTINFNILNPDGSLPEEVCR